MNHISPSSRKLISGLPKSGGNVVMSKDQLLSIIATIEEQADPISRAKRKASEADVKKNDLYTLEEIISAL